MTGTDLITYARKKPGMSTFVLEEGVVYHAYSAYARGLDGLWGAYQWLDRAPKGRNENGYWWRRPRRVREELSRSVTIAAATGPAPAEGRGGDRRYRYRVSFRGLAARASR
jgi:hypothetical protein